MDTAVLQAYGCADLHATPADTPELLMRLVALNARRAAVEKAGLVRWLRPEFQNPEPTQLLSNNEQYNHIAQGLQADFALNESGEAVKPVPTPTPSTTQAWSATLPEQARVGADWIA